MAQYVKLGPKASFFRAAAIDVSVAPGKVVALKAKQMNNGLVKRALNGGHLVLTTKEDQKPESTKLTPEQIHESFVEMASSGEDAKKIAKNFFMEELKTIAATYEIEVEADDKKVDVVTAILDEIAEAGDDQVDPE